jgi:S1-C subfamily serine protease
MKYNYALIPAIIGVSIAIIQPQIALALSRDQVNGIAEKITVLIDSQEPGSGVIIKKEGNTYTVLTAYHVVKNPNFKYEIVTSDNQRYSVKYSSVKTLAKDIDLAVLQFTSNQNYQVAKIGNSEQAQRRSKAYVAGFPRPTGAIRRSIYDLQEGQISANASQAFDGGYALVYDNVTLPGMSGGPVMNDKGEVIAIHGRGDAITIATSEVNTRVAFVKSGRNLGIPINTFVRLSARVGVDVGINLGDTQNAAIAFALPLTSVDVSQKAKEITVIIKGKGAKQGSGVIIAKQVDTYHVLTNWHVMDGKGNYLVQTPDNAEYRINSSLITRIAGVDLAVFEFNSSKKYNVATIGNSNAVKEGATVYVSGAPIPLLGIEQRTVLFTDGKIVGKHRQPKDGYALIYNNNTYKGMSGGPVVDENARLIGIHGRGTRDGTDGEKVGFNLGIPINIFMQSEIGKKLVLVTNNQTIVAKPSPPSQTLGRPPVIRGDDDGYVKPGRNY